MTPSLEELLTICRPCAAQGQVASYIPELRKSDPHCLGVCLLSCQGERQTGGDAQVLFTVQSVIKPLLLLQALLDNGVEVVRAHVGVEATGKPFVVIINSAAPEGSEAQALCQSLTAEYHAVCLCMNCMTMELPQIQTLYCQFRDSLKLSIH